VLKQKTGTQIKRRIVMWKKILIPSLSIALLLVISAPMSSVNAENSRIVNWRIAGTIVQSIEVFNPLDPDISEGFYSLINLTARGAPGSAKITLLSRVTETPPPIPPDPDPFLCADGYVGPVAYFDQNDMVAIFFDQSLLFASIDDTKHAILCIGVVPGTTLGTTYFKVKMNVTRGTGRFERVSGGMFIGEGNGYPVNSETTLAGENGTMTGTIDFD
jgi:hypothetical protein